MNKEFFFEFAFDDKSVNSYEEFFKIWDYVHYVLEILVYL